MKTRTPFILSILLIFLIGITQAQEESGEPSLLLKKKLKAVISDLEIDIPDLMEKARIPGLQIAVIRDQKENGTGKVINKPLSSIVKSCHFFLFTSNSL